MHGLVVLRKPNDAYPAWVLRAQPGAQADLQRRGTIERLRNTERAVAGRLAYSLNQRFGCLLLGPTKDR